MTEAQHSAIASPIAGRNDLKRIIADLDDAVMLEIPRCPPPLPKSRKRRFGPKARATSSTVPVTR